MRIKINKNWVRLATEKYPILHRFLRWNDGLLVDLQDEHEKGPRNYFLGASPVIKEVLQPNGDWTAYMGENEAQSGRFESFSCVTFSLLNILEALAKRQFGEAWNKSDRFTSKMSGTTQNGNSMDNVVNSARKLHGLLNQLDYPNQIDEITWMEFFQTIPKTLQDKALIFLTEHEIFFERLPDSRFATIKQALTFSPVWCGGFAWYPQNGIYISYGNPNHAFCIQRIDGNNLIAKDSYDPYDKKLAVNYKIAYPKIIILKKKLNQPNINTMATNVKILKDKNSSTIVFAASVLNESAFESYALNYDIECPKTAEGKLDWDK